jgi:tetratricopeptide (TPR) repeat protein
MTASQAGLSPADDSLETVEALRERLSRYPAARYPIQHATASFHLGLALTNAGRLSEAAEALEHAAALFDQRLLAEHARSLNALGAVHRLETRYADAARAFRRAADEFKQADLPRDLGAALYNLGLVQREAGKAAAAAAAFRRAAAIFKEKDVGARAAAVRELGITLLGEGLRDPAVEALTEAVALAEGAGDMRGAGAAANGLGIALLACGRPEAAVESFSQSAAANPRRLRPAEYAMAKANLALAYTELGNTTRARLAAGQALAVEQASEPVRSQAAAVLAGIAAGAGPGAVLAVLLKEPLQTWPGILREEMMRWSDLDASALADELAAWIAGQVADEREADLAEALVGALLELRPEETEKIIRALLEVLIRQPSITADRFRSQLVTAISRFRAPQSERLTEIINHVATQLGQEASW